jgi:hypothetical protein
MTAFRRPAPKGAGIRALVVPTYFGGDHEELAIAAVAGSALLTGIVTASAADMAVKDAPIPMAPAPFSWTDF